MPQPHGNLTIRTIAMPAETNANGDIFGGWLVSQMDLAASVIAKQTAGGRVATVAIDGMAFIRPVHVGDYVCCYAELLEVGRSSMKINVEVWIFEEDDHSHQVTEGVFTFVALTEDGKPRAVRVKGMRH